MWFISALSRDCIEKYRGNVDKKYKNKIKCNVKSLVSLVLFVKGVGMLRSRVVFWVESERVCQ